MTNRDKFYFIIGLLFAIPLIGLFYYTIVAIQVIAVEMTSTVPENEINRCVKVLKDNNYLK